MRRFIVISLAVIASSWLVTCTVVRFQPAEAATTCSLSVAMTETTDPGQIAKPFINMLVCYVNLLRVRANSSAQVKRVCGGTQTVPAGARVMVIIPAGMTLTSATTVILEAEDTTSPPLLDRDGLESPSGTNVRGWMFNRDPNATRTGRLCAAIIT